MPCCPGKLQIIVFTLLFIHHKALDKTLTSQNLNSYPCRWADEQCCNNVAWITNQSDIYMCIIPFLSTI